MASHEFQQVDVFAPTILRGNPVAVVRDADDLDTPTMAAIARWINLSETAFLLRTTDPDADYRVRFFAPGGELPFAGHPTLGTAHAWLEWGGRPRRLGRIVQECGIGAVQLRDSGTELAFRAPELLRSGEVDGVTLVRALASLGVAVNEVVHAQWIDNGPGWLGVVLPSAGHVLGVRPDFTAMGELRVGLLGPYGTDGPADYEVRAFEPSLVAGEDPVTGSLIAGFAIWLTRAGLAPPDFTVQQGTAVQRAGRAHVSTDADDVVWVGGPSHTIISGTLSV